MNDGKGLDKVTHERLAQSSGRLKAGNVGVLSAGAYGAVLSLEQ